MDYLIRTILLFILAAFFFSLGMYDFLRSIKRKKILFPFAYGIEVSHSQNPIIYWLSILIYAIALLSLFLIGISFLIGIISFL